MSIPSIHCSLLELTIEVMLVVLRRYDNQRHRCGDAIDLHTDIASLLTRSKYNNLITPAHGGIIKILMRSIICVI